jgi:hypothetical protein
MTSACLYPQVHDFLIRCLEPYDLAKRTISPSVLQGIRALSMGLGTSLSSVVQIYSVLAPFHTRHMCMPKNNRLITSYPTWRSDLA